MENDLKDKIDNLGSDMIMDVINKFEQGDGKENLEKLNEAIEENIQNNKETNEVAMGTNPDIASMVYRRARFIHPMVKNHKIRRNDPCPCGSKLKYKNCCLSSGRYETYSRI